MRLVLLTLCLVGLGQAGPTAPSFITDPYIRALYENIDGRITKVTWNTGGSKLSDVAAPKYDIELCHNSEATSPTTVAGAVRVGLPNKGTGFVQLGEATNDKPDQKCYTFKNKDKIAKEGEILTFVLWNVDDKEHIIGFAVGSIEKYYGVSKVTKGLNCNKKEDNYGITFMEDRNPNEYGHFGILFCLSKECILNNKDNFPYEVDESVKSNKLLCIPSTKDNAGKGITNYCQTVKVAETTPLTVESLNYNPYEIAFPVGSFEAAKVIGMCHGNEGMKKGGVNPDFEAEDNKITLKNGYDKPTDNLYTVIVEGDKIGRIQDLKVVVEKSTFKDNPFYSFSFSKTSGVNKYEASIKADGKGTGDTETIDCTATTGNDCYGFLQPGSVTHNDFTLTFADKTNKIICKPSQ